MLTESIWIAPSLAAVARTCAAPARAGFLTPNPSDASARRRASGAEISMSAGMSVATAVDDKILS
jgi:hypothetical protein